MEYLRNLDLKFFYELNSFAGKSALTDEVIIFFASYVAFILAIVFVVLVYRSKYSWRKKLMVLSVVPFSSLFALYGVSALIKLFYFRPRPFLVHEVTQLFDKTSYSFPSDHATFFFTLAFALYFWNKKWGFWFFIGTLLMGVARVMSGVHYPSDVIGGMLIGLTVSFVVYKYTGRVLKRLSR